MSLLMSLLTVVLASVVIMYACNSFDASTSYLGRNMPAGVKGATLNAIGSSLPELLTTFFLLFLYHDQDGFSAGIATCAGSAVFNAVIIPALCILAVTWKGVAEDGKAPVRLPYIVLKRTTILRDGIFFILAEMLLIYFLKDSVMVWWMGGALMAVYLVYFFYLMVEYILNPNYSADEEDEPVGGQPFWTALSELDYHSMLFGNLPQSTGRAVVVLLCSIATITGACYFLSGAVLDSAAALGVPAYFTAVILGAGATSVPDTIISLKDARAGNYDDAVANAVGSNIFDICICLGLPLFAYGLAYGNVTLAGAGAADVQDLRIALVAVTVVVLTLFLIPRTIRQWKGWLLLGTYGAWMVFILGRATGIVVPGL